MIFLHPPKSPITNKNLTVIGMHRGESYNLATRHLEKVSFYIFIDTHLFQDIPKILQR